MASVMSNGARPNAFMQLISTGMGTPILIVIMMAMVILPLPAFLLDVLFTFNITLAISKLYAPVGSGDHLIIATAFRATAALTQRHKP